MLRRLYKVWSAIREYIRLFADGEADFEDYVLAVLLMAYAFILFAHILPSV